MEHQRTAVAKLLPSRVGALFMEMGTGKSRATIELAKIRRQKIDKLLWLCPVSLKRTIEEEIVKHTNCQPSDICVFDERTSETHLPEAFWYICGIESMSASVRVVLTINALITERTFVVVDEATYIKGHRSKRTERITDYAAKARYRLILTGTPLTQGVIDLYAQMRFLSQKILGFRSFYSFARNHLEYPEKYPGMIVRTHNVEQLAAKIAPYVYQVTKDECLDLPAKVYKTRYFEMTSGQRSLYEQAKIDLLSEVTDDYLDSMYAIFRLFTALQQITCGFWNWRDEEGERQHSDISHRRLHTLGEIIETVPASAKVVIWAKFHYDIEGIVRTLSEKFDGEVAQFHGKLSERERHDELQRFRGAARFFVATPSCGGHGLTLNEASYVVFYNNGFKYSERLQAEDRCHRIGTTSSVVYTDIVCSNSIDERIQRALSRKEDIADSFRREVQKVKKEKLRERLMQL